MHTHLHCRGSAYTVMRGVEHPVGHIDHHHVELGQAGLVLVSQRKDRLLYKLREKSPPSASRTLQTILCTTTPARGSEW